MDDTSNAALAEAQAAFEAGRDASDPTARAEAAEAALTEANARADSAKANAHELQTQLDATEAAAMDLRSQLEAANARADAAEKKAAAKVSRVDAPAKLRAIGPMADGKALSGDRLKDAIASAEKVEIAFSDGKKEIGAAQPVVVEGEVWRAHTLGLMLKDPVTVSGPTSPPGFSIDGYALLLDGKQVAYCKRSDPLNVAPGQTVNIADDIYF